MASLVITIPQTTQLSETELEKNLQVYPNPVAKNFTIKNIGESVVYIYSLNGALVKQFQISGNAQVDVSDLPNGVYVLKLENTDRIKITRIIKHSTE